MNEDDDAVELDHQADLHDELDGDEPIDPDEEAAIFDRLARKNKLRIFIPLALVILLSYLLFGGPLKAPTTPSTDEKASTESPH